MGGSDHCDFESRSIIDKLLQESEQSFMTDISPTASILVNDWKEAVSGWKDVGPNVQYKAAQQPRKKRAQPKEARYKSRRYQFTSIRLPSVEATSASGHNSHESSKSPDAVKTPICEPSVRCVDEDYVTSGIVAAWKANVEPVTYRYVPNNGTYRKNKYPKVADHLFPNRPIHLSMQNRHLRKEIQRELRKGLDPRNYIERSRTDQIRGTPANDAEGELNRERSKSDSTLLITDQRPSPVPLPLRDDPLMSSSVNDKFIDSFTSRLSVLDDEMKQDAKLYRKSRLEEEIRGPFCRARIKDSRFSPVTLETLNHEIFSIKPLRSKQQNLRPLEKITPQQRIAENLSKMTVAQLKYTNASNGDTLNLPSDSTAMNKKNLQLFENVRYDVCEVDHSSQSKNADNSTLQSVITTTKVIPNNKYSITKVLSSTNTEHVSEHKGTLLSPNGLTPRIEKEYNTDSLPSPEILDGDYLLQGISGKRMTVPLVYNR